MPQFSYRDIIKRLKKSGFCFKRSAKGSHKIWINEVGQQITVPNHKVIATGTALNIAKDAGFKNLKDFENFK
jgi:predicted RNA binding protein YcfA (HicA-like mRNA interferase family)